MNFSMHMFAQVVMFALASSTACADTVVGTLSLTGTIESALSVTIESAGGTAILGSGVASTHLGNVSKFGSAPTGFSQTRSADYWSLVSNIGVKVVKANSNSGSYSLNAQLATAPLPSINWFLDGKLLSDTSSLLLNTTGAYDAVDSYNWTIQVFDDASSGALNNTVGFTAIGN